MKQADAQQGVYVDAVSRRHASTDVQVSAPLPASVSLHQDQECIATGSYFLSGPVSFARKSLRLFKVHKENIFQPRHLFPLLCSSIPTSLRNDMLSFITALACQCLKIKGQDAGRSLPASASMTERGARWLLGLRS